MILCPSSTFVLIAAICRGPVIGDAPLKAGTLQDPDLAPFVLRFPVREALPVSLVGPGHTVLVRGRELRVDTLGTGSLDKTISKPSQTIVVRKGKSQISVLLYREDDAWNAVPATTARASIGKKPIEFLDADCDGDCFSTNDWVRFDDGGFQSCTKEHMLASGELIVSYEVVPGKSPVVKWQVQVKPAWANDLQWAGLLAANTLRNQHGLPPLALDEQRSRGCQLHAQYLYVNNYDYSKPWDGVGSHEELPGREGFTEEGRIASHDHATAGSADPVEMAQKLFSTMLHRTKFLGAGGFGVGSIDKCQNSSAVGYTVIGGPDCVIGSFEEIVVVPGPGSRRVPRRIEDERPAPEKLPLFYSKSRGYPISITFGKLKASEFSIELFKGEKLVKCSGVMFSPAEPIHSTRPENAESVFFVPDDVLESDEVYEARFRCTMSGKPRELVWRFRGDK